jgi:hypothetical protein
MEYKYGFDKCKTFAEVKERRKRLSLLLHPDKGGDDELFKSMIAESEQRVEDLTDLFKGQEKQPKQQVQANDRMQQFGTIAASILRADAVQECIARELKQRLNPQMAQIVTEILSKV